MGATVKVICYKSKVLKNNECPLMIRVTKDRKLKYVSLGTHFVHHTIARHCDYCGTPMSPSDVNDFGSLCERCYMKEYYGK